jgi:hypothetical protein
MPSADGRRGDDSDQPFGRMAAANVLIGQTRTYIGQGHRKGNPPGRITLDDEWYLGPGGKSSSRLAISRLITIKSVFQGRLGLRHVGVHGRKSAGRAAAATGSKIGSICTAPALCGTTAGWSGWSQDGNRLVGIVDRPVEQLRRGSADEHPPLYWRPGRTGAAPNHVVAQPSHLCFSG